MKMKMKMKMKMESKRKRKRYADIPTEEEERRTSKKMKVEANIPTDVLVDILSRLPAKCVWRFRSVCKDWKSLIEAPYFADLQLRQSKEEGEEVFMFWSDRRSGGGRTRFYSIDYKNGKAVKVVEEDLSHPSDTTTSSINGLVCYYGTDWDIKVCNPITRETITLPKPTFLSSSSSEESYLDLGIGFDSTSNTYKILASSCLDRPQIEIFTLGERGTNPHGWRKLQLPSLEIVFFSPRGFYANGCAFWEIFEHDPDENEDEDMPLTLLTFNFAEEKFEMFPYPPDFEIHRTVADWTNQVGGRGCLIQAKSKRRMVKMWTLAPDSSGKQVWVDHHTLLPRFNQLLPQPVIFPIPSGVMLFKTAKRYMRRDKRFKRKDKPKRITLR